jgi:hypothetical protein
MCQSARSLVGLKNQQLGIFVSWCGLAMVPDRHRVQVRRDYLESAVKAA